MRWCSSSSGSTTLSKVGWERLASSPMRARLADRSSRTAGSTCSGRMCRNCGSGSWPSRGLPMHSPSGLGERHCSGPCAHTAPAGSAPRATSYNMPGSSGDVMSEKFDLVVIGGGSGGVATARRAAEYGARVALAESGRLGGTCVNVGCVPKKLMWHAAELGGAQHDAAEYGFDLARHGHDWAALRHKRDVYITHLNGLYAANLARQQVEVIHGRARFEDAHTVSVAGRTLSAPHIVIATGGCPRRPQIPGAELGITSDGFFELDARPPRVAVV